MPVIGPNAVLSIAKKATGIRIDPYSAYNFLVEIDGIISGGFTEVSGLSITTAVKTVKEGGMNDFEHKLPEATSYTDITLKKGITDMDTIWGWYDNVVKGKVERKNGTIYLLDHQGLPAMWWDFYEAFPVKWDGPSFNAATNTVATESLVLTHHGLKKPEGSQLLSAVRGVASVGGIL